MEPRLAPDAALAIEHIEGSNPPSFKLTRLSDSKSLALVALPSPSQQPVEGRPNSNLMHQP